MTYWIEYFDKNLGHYKPLKHWRSRENEWSDIILASSYYAWIIKNCPNSPLNKHPSRLVDTKEDVYVCSSRPRKQVAPIISMNTSKHPTSEFDVVCGACNAKLRCPYMEVTIYTEGIGQTVCQDCFVSEFNIGCVPKRK